MDGKTVSAYVKEQIKNECAILKQQGITPGLAVIIVGNDSASRIYVNNKKKACADTGIYSEEYALPEDTSEEMLIELIKQLNKKAQINGILVQLPLPKHISESAVIEAIDPSKDVDAFHAENTGRIMSGNYRYLPCTPAGILEILDYYKIDCTGKHCVIIGRSNIVGKPTAMMMLKRNATVTVCHSKTENLKDICKTADILVVAIGKAKFVTADMVKQGAVVVDVGINRDENGKLSGDVAFDEVKEKASFITPVPGGVGPMTISMLLKNTITATRIQNKI